MHISHPPLSTKHLSPIIYMYMYTHRPVAMAEVFNPFSGLLPGPINNHIHTLASSAVFKAPIIRYVMLRQPHRRLILQYTNIHQKFQLGAIPSSTCSIHACRHIWTWLGIRPVGRESIKALLNQGKSVAINPGGVVECIRMQHGKETVYLKNRRGFVRVAQETVRFGLYFVSGHIIHMLPFLSLIRASYCATPLALSHNTTQDAKVVPVYVFNQTKVYSYVKFELFGLVERFARAAGFAPLIFWGYCGTPVRLMH